MISKNYIRCIATHKTASALIMFVLFFVTPKRIYAIDTHATAVIRTTSLAVIGIVTVSLVALMSIVSLYLYASKRQAVREKDEIAWREECYRTVVKNSNIIVFDYNYESDTLETNENFELLFERSLTYDELKNHTYIHSDDVDEYEKLGKCIFRREPVCSATLRISNQNGLYIWCKVSVTALYNKNGELKRMMGLIMNIDEETRTLEKISEIARTDSLTGLYNKKTFEELIRKELRNYKNKNGCAMLIVDIDNFKKTNDTYGHACGDDVIRAVSATLNLTFRSSDIIGRIGGDEFAVFIRDLTSEQALYQILHKVLTAFAETKTDTLNNEHFTCSIGAAFDPTASKSFEELYKASDEALYEAKRCGKNTFKINKK